MRMQYDPNLIEQANFLAARLNPHLEAELHSAIDPIYESPPGSGREQRFLEANRHFFARLKLGKKVDSLLAERPAIGLRVGKCIVREAQRGKLAGLDLFVRADAGNPAPDTRTLIIQLTPQQLVDPDSLRLHLRREILQVTDILDEEFGYDRNSLEGPTVHMNLLRDRYHALWAIHVDGRLSREGRAPVEGGPEPRRKFRLAFTIEGQPPPEAPFDVLFSRKRITHGQLLHWARSPETLPGWNDAVRTPPAVSVEVCSSQ